MEDFISPCRTISTMDWYDIIISIQHPDFFAKGAVFCHIRHSMRVNYPGFGNRIPGSEKILT
jgi:hypothetical protein